MILQYFFQFGRHPQLSLVELFSACERFGIECAVDRLVAGGCVLTVNSTIDCAALQECLGGTIRIVRLYPEAECTPEVLSEQIQERISEGAFRIGISSFTYVSARRFGDRCKQATHRLALRLKSSLRATGRPVRLSFPDRRELILSGGQLQHHRIMSDGLELVFIYEEDYKCSFGITEAAQDIEWYSQRDVGRPVRDMLVGMMPVKLSQILLNSARVAPEGSILDPFCGLGTLIQEGALMGYEMSGSDLEQRMVEATTKNMEWLQAIAPDDRSLSMKKCVPSDASDIGRHFTEPFDAIVTEGTLGPAMSKTPSSHEIKNTWASLKTIYLRSFEAFLPLLKTGGRVVITFPFYRFNGQSEDQFVPFVDEILSLGYVLDTCSDMPFSDYLSYTERDTMLYSRPDQFVGREVAIFIKK